MPQAALTAASIVPYLKRCNYDAARLEQDYNFGSGRVPVAAFADSPHDTRSVCIAAIDAPSEPEAAVIAARPLGAPVVFAIHGGKLQWWKQTTARPLLQETIEGSRVAEFFRRRREDFDPTHIFEGKTRLRLPGQTQLSFVDAGLMPFIERADGERLSDLVVAAFGDIESVLKRKLRSEKDAQKAIQATFWLLAAKALHDKQAVGFKNVTLSNIDDVFARVGRHYGVRDGVPPSGRAWHAATTKAAGRIGGFGSLRNLSTESLAHVYENALVTKEVRKANGTHSTPGPLVDYIVWQLWPWIEDLPRERRHVFEPACGHGAFLVSALRVLRQWSSNTGDRKTCHEYLKKHLHGIERDPFAIEVARLSLTLADIPCGNTWDLKQGDMFLGSALEDGAARCGVLLANPPFERFSASERATYKKAGVKLGANTKACEMLRRTIPHLTNGACFGVVVPRSLLNSHEGVELRRAILADFELSEIDVFEDKLFAKSDQESTVLLGRRRTGRARNTIWSRRVRNDGIEDFRNRFAFSAEEQVEVTRFKDSETADLRVPDFVFLWDYFEAYPKLSAFADVGQGFSFRGRDLPENAQTLSERPKAGFVPCFVTARGNPPIFGVPERQWMNPAPEVIQAKRMGLDCKPGQVIVNHARGARNQWSMKAWLDQEGLAVKGNFLVVIPKSPEVPGTAIWALLNGPVANAFVYCWATKRHIIHGDLLRLPIPRAPQDWIPGVVSAAQAYLTTVKDTGGFFQPDPDKSVIKAKLLALDAAVLRAYNLPPRLERQLLDLFTGVKRKGVGCEFTGYYPAGFSSFFPLHYVISDSFKRAAADATYDRFKPGQSDYVRKVLAAAAGEDEE